MSAAFSDLCAKKGRAKPYVICAHVINRFNAHEIEAVYRLGVRVGVDAIRYQIMHACSSTESLLPDKKQIELAAKDLEKVKRLARDAGIDIVSNIDYQLPQANRAIAEGSPAFHWSRDLFDGVGCLVGWYFARSFTDGRLSFCCHDKITGNLKRGGFADHFRSERYRRIRQAAKTFDPNKVNPDLTDDCCGSDLIDAECAFCGNYEFMLAARRDLEKLSLLKHLSREPPPWP
jgi:hypothetical protein